MFRALVFFAILAAAIWGAVSLADHPGSVSLQWGGYRVDTSFAVLLAIVTVLAVAAALIYRFRDVLRMPAGGGTRAGAVKSGMVFYRGLATNLPLMAAFFSQITGPIVSWVIPTSNSDSPRW